MGVAVAAYDRPRSAASTPAASPHRGLNYQHALRTSPPEFKRQVAGPRPVRRQQPGSYGRQQHEADHPHSARRHPRQEINGGGELQPDLARVPDQLRLNQASVGGGSDRKAADPIWRNATDHGRSDSAQSLAEEGFAVARQDGKSIMPPPPGNGLSNASCHAAPGSGNPIPGLGNDSRQEGRKEGLTVSPRLEIHASATAVGQLQHRLDDSAYISGNAPLSQNAAQPGIANDATEHERAGVPGSVGRTASGMSTGEIELLQVCTANRSSELTRV